MHSGKATKCIATLETLQKIAKPFGLKVGFVRTQKEEEKQKNAWCKSIQTFHQTFTKLTTFTVFCWTLMDFAQRSRCLKWLDINGLRPIDGDYQAAFESLPLRHKKQYDLEILKPSSVSCLMVPWYKSESNYHPHAKTLSAKGCSLILTIEYSKI